jgi:DNA-binding transcriptional LysR family regulator
MVQSRIDVALRLTRPTDYGLLARRLAPVPLAVVASPRVLARWCAPDDVEALSERPCIVDMQHSFQNRWPVVDGHVRVPSRVRVRGAREAMWFAQAGHGFALVPRLVAESSLDLGILVEVVPGSITAGWSLWAVTVERRLRTARTQAFLDHVVAAHASD